MKKLTVLISTSPVPSHPNTEMLDRVIESVRQHLGLPFELMIVCDGPHRESVKKAYGEYKARLRKKYTAKIIASDEQIGRAMGLRRAIPLVKTPFLLVHAHDFMLTRKVDGPAVLQALETHEDVKFIRLNQRENACVGWDFRLEERPDSMIPLVKAGCWTDDPSVALTKTWKTLILPLMRSREHLEFCIMHRPGWGWKRHARLGLQGFYDHFGVCLYGGLGDEATCEHLDGRRAYVVRGAG